MSTKKLRAASYCRVSTGRQVEGESLDTQAEQIQAFCNQKDWELVRVYSDEGKSGSSTEHRTEFKQMMSDARAGAFDVIVIWKLSRLSRSARDYQNTVHELKKSNVLLVSVKENIDPTTNTGKLMAGLLSLFAEFERETIEENMSENRSKRWKDRRITVGKSPLGYRYDKAEKVFKIHEPEAEMYRRIVTMYTKQEMSMRDICNALNDEGIFAMQYRTKPDRSPYKTTNWTPCMVRFVLTNPIYYGEYVVNQYEYTTDQNGHSRRSNIKKPATEHIRFDVEALISKTEWDRIQEIIEERKVRRGTNRTGEYTDLSFLRDVCICGQCRYRIRAKQGRPRQDGSQLRYYTCYARLASEKQLKLEGKKACDMPFIPAEELESKVWSELMLGLAMNPKKVFSKLLRPAELNQRVGTISRGLEQLKKERKAKERAEKNLYVMVEAPEVDVNRITEQVRSVQSDIVDIESKIKEQQKKLEEVTGLRDEQETVRKLLKKSKPMQKAFRTGLKEQSLKDRKTLIEGMLITPITVKYSPPDEN